MSTPVIAFLCGIPHPSSRPRFEAEAERAGARALWLDPHELAWTHEGLILSGEPLATPDVIVPRNGGLTSDRVLGVLRSFESAGVPLVNDSAAVEISRDKLDAYVALECAGVRVPNSLSVASEADLLEAAKQLEYPYVLKSRRGMGGEAVSLVRHLDDALAALALLEPPVMAQRFIPTEGFDVRVTVVDGRALGAVRRTHALDDFRGNTAAGAESTAHDLDDELAEIAVQAADALALDVAGVDLVFGSGGYVVLEVNSAPGFDAFERTTGVNVAAAVVALALNRVARGR